MRIVYARRVYITQVNSRIRPVGDGLVAAMAHLWSKFTKCLRPSEGASDPDPLPSPPNVVPPSAQCHVIRYYYVVAITTSRKQRDPSSFHLSFALCLACLLLLSLCHVQICISSFCDLPNNPKLFRL